MLVTLAKNAADLAEEDDDDNNAGPASKLLLVDHQTGGHTPLMTLDRAYDGLGWVSGKTFYATLGNQLYLLNPINQTETLLGTLSADDVFGLEFAGQHLMGFENNHDTLLPIDSTNGGSASSGSLVGMVDLGTIVFVPVDKDPVNLADAYD